MSTFGDILTSVFDRSARLLDRRYRDEASLEDLTGALLSSRGEASGIALADEILCRYAELAETDRQAFYEHLATDLDPDPDAASVAAAEYSQSRSSAALRTLIAATEPPRQALFRRLNMAPNGTARLVAMRADLRVAMREDPNLARVDDDIAHLLGSWFNRGFLVLRRIDWSTPAAVLEKIIQYEAVHEIDSWDELRRRVEPPDRRCFAFFHPAMPDEPLIFVEVALTGATPGSIQELLDPKREPIDPDQASTAVFYSISNCQPGLAGVSFGAFLIKQVAYDLSTELPGVETFATLSPVPGFMRWLRNAPGEVAEQASAALSKLESPDWSDDPAVADDLRPVLLSLAAKYFLDAKRGDGQPIDPVARFHLGNGAELQAIHWMGDRSPRGIAQSAGVMVNYLYRLDRIEANHEAYASEGQIVATRAVRALNKV